MNLKQRIIMMSSIGFGLGIFMGVMISALSSMPFNADGSFFVCSKGMIDAVGNPFAAFTIHVLGSGIFGIIAMGGSSVYAIESWGLAKCTSIHYLTTMTCYFIVGFLLRWFSLKDMTELIVLFLIMTAVYIIIWMANYFGYKSELKKINRGLDKLKSSDVGGKI